VVREKIRLVYRDIEKKGQENAEKNDTAYAGCGLDADGLHIWNAANAGTATGDTPLPGQPDSGVPDAAASAVGEAGGSPAEPHRGDGAGSAVPASAAGISAVRAGQ
jgi:hypothetical protein